MTNVEYPILIDSYYNGSNNLPTDPSADAGQTYVAGQTPLWENIYFSNITSTSFNPSDVAGVIYGLPEAPVANVYFFNVNLGVDNTGLEMNHAPMFTSTLIRIYPSSELPRLPRSIGAASGFPAPYAANIVPSLYNAAFIGSPSVPGGTSETQYDPDSQHWTIVGDGTGISGTSDEFISAFGPVTGNFTLQAQLKALPRPADAVSRRASCSATAPALPIRSPRSSRTPTIRSSSNIAPSQVAMPLAPLRSLPPAGRSISGSSAPAPTLSPAITAPMAPIGPRSVPLRLFQESATPLQAGVAVASGIDGTVATAVFANFSQLPGPTIIQPANAIFNPVTTNSTTLSALADDISGAGALAYTWSYTGPSGVTYQSANGGNFAKSIIADFTQAGSYNFTVTVSNPLGLTTTSAVNVTVSRLPQLSRLRHRGISMSPI